MLGRRWAHPEQFLPLLLRLLALGCGVVLICELAIYYMVLLRCGWPRLKAPAEPGQDRPSAPALRTLFLADTHLLGALRGHWLDKLRREWQMERAFQTALWLFEPDAVFVLGDLFDEGKWSSPKLDPNHSGGNCKDKDIFPESAPILLQHYPLYRVSDAECTGEDSASPEEKKLLFRERYDTLSVEASNMLLWWLQPRLVLSGHTHSACTVQHGSQRPEISIPSFSWRNRNNPSFLLATITATDFAIHKCFMPRESTVFTIYMAAGGMAVLLIVLHFHLFQWAMHNLTHKLVNLIKGHRCD